jgi:hypothetical protein
MIALPVLEVAARPEIKDKLRAAGIAGLVCPARPLLPRQQVRTHGLAPQAAESSSDHVDKYSTGVKNALVQPTNVLIGIRNPGREMAGILN